MGGFNKYGSSDNYVLLGGGGDKPVSDFMLGNNGYDYVEIGGLKWATMNVGANSVTDYGLYFQWGDINGYIALQCGSGTFQKPFGWADYKYGNGTSSPGSSGMTRYNSSDLLTRLDIVDDAAHANWSGMWRMPTKDEYIALGNAVNTTWTTNYQGSGVAGLVCSAKTDSSKVLFFPACGYCLNGSVYNVGIQGYYRSSSRHSSRPTFAFYFRCANGQANFQDNDYRNYGYTVRGVIG